MRLKFEREKRPWQKFNFYNKIPKTKHSATYFKTRVYAQFIKAFSIKTEVIFWLQAISAWQVSTSVMLYGIMDSIFFCMTCIHDETMFRPMLTVPTTVAHVGRSLTAEVGHMVWIALRGKAVYPVILPLTASLKELWQSVISHVCWNLQDYDLIDRT